MASNPSAEAKAALAKGSGRQGDAPVPYSVRRVVVTTVSILAGALILLMLYVLSYGPAVALRHHGYVSNHAVNTFYSPIKEVCETPYGRKHFEPWLDWYERLWW